MTHNCLRPRFRESRRDNSEIKPQVVRAFTLIALINIDGELEAGGGACGHDGRRLLIQSLKQHLLCKKGCKSRATFREHAESGGAITCSSDLSSLFSPNFKGEVHKVVARTNIITIIY